MKKLLLGSFLLASIAATAQNGLRCSPMPGYCDLREVSIWVQTIKPTDVSVEVRIDSSNAGLYQTKPIKTTDEDSCTATLILPGLEPGVTYKYQILLDGKPTAFPAGVKNTFTTQPLWAYRTEPPTFSFLTGSCAYINEPQYDRPGKPYGGDYRIFKSMAASNANFMLWLGDNTYLREPDWNSWAGILHRYSHTRRTESMQPLLGNMFHYAIWDDHDYGPNDADRTFIHKDKTIKAFKQWWPNPSYGIPGNGGITTAFRYIDCDFFLLDDRTFRVNQDCNTCERTMLGEEQIDWLVESLKGSSGSFKFVALGSQFLNPLQTKEVMANYPEERQKIIDRISAEGIKNVIFLTGDRHFTELDTLVMKSGNMLYDLTVSPLTSGVGKPDLGNTLQAANSLVTKQNYAKFEVSGTKKQRKLTIFVYDMEGVLIWKREIQSQL